MTRHTKPRRGANLLLALPLLALSLPLGAQTVPTRVSEEARLRQIEERLHAVQEARTAQMHEAQAHYQELLAEMQARMKHSEELSQAEIEEIQQRMTELQHMAQSRNQEAQHLAQTQHQEALRLYEEIAARNLTEVGEQEARARMMAREQEARGRELRVLMEEEGARMRLEAREQSREQEARARELRDQMRVMALRVRERGDEARVRAEQEARRFQEVVFQVRSRIRLGVSLDVTQGDEYDRQGVRLSDVIDDSPAQDAGLEEGDIITHLNGHYLLDPIPNEDDEDFDLDESLPVQRLMALAGDLDEGDEVTVEYLRDGQAASVGFLAAEMDEPYVVVSPGGRRNIRIYSDDPEEGGRWNFTMPDREDFRIALPNFEALRGLEDMEDRFSTYRWDDQDRGNFRVVTRGGEDGANWFTVLGGAGLHGLELAELNPGLATYFSTEEGVLILNVDEDSELGLQAGDVILSIGDRDVADKEDVHRILSSYEDDEDVVFTVMREGRQVQTQGIIR